MENHCLLSFFSFHREGRVTKIPTVATEMVIAIEAHHRAMVAADLEMVTTTRDEVAAADHLPMIMDREEEAATAQEAVLRVAVIEAEVVVMDLAEGKESLEYPS